MKTRITFSIFIVFFLGLSSYSQSLSKMGENYIKQYNTSIGKIKSMEPGSPKLKGEIANAERIIASLKKSDPNYNTSTLYSELETYKSSSSTTLSNNGKTYLKEIEKRFETLDNMDAGSKTYQDEIVIAKRNIDYLSKSDPNYDILSLEEKLESYKSNLKTATTKNQKQLKSQQSLDSELNTYLSFEISFTYNRDELNANQEEALKFEKEFSEYLNNNLAKDPNANLILPKIEENWLEGSIDKETIESYPESIKTSTSASYSENEYNRIKVINTKWKLLSKVFPESEVLKGAVQETDNLLQLEGGKEGVLKLVAKNKLENAKKLRMTPAALNDASINQLINKALKECNHAKSRTIVKINIVSSSWAIQKNEITGKIISRALTFEAALKNSDGTCVLLKSSWYQEDYNGSSYGKGYITHGDIYDIICENINK